MNAHLDPEKPVTRNYQDYITENVIDPANHAKYLERTGLENMDQAAAVEMKHLRTEDGGDVYALIGADLLLWSGQADTMISADGGETWKHV